MEAPRSMTARLEARDLTLTRGETVVIAGVGFALSGGDAMILRGPNGAGKSTLLRALAGLLKPMSGTISYGGADAADAASLFTHDNALKAALTARENLDFWQRMSRAPRNRTQTAAQTLDLSALLERPVGSLSAGQRRRLGFARMLVEARSVWLLDEPTASMDIASARRVADAVEGHCAAGGLAVIATHEPLDIYRATNFVMEAA